MPDIASPHPPAAPRTAPPRRRAATAEPAPNRRLSILLAAEKLFGLNGYHAVSIRDIATEAGVPLALVGYHYGAKHELYHAIFESWQPSMQQRTALLAEAMASRKAPDALERVIDAFVAPVVALHADPAGQYYALMAARELAAPTAESDRAQREFFDPMAHAFIDGLNSLFAKAKRGDVAWCYQFMLGTLLHFLSDVRVERLSRGQNRAADPAHKDTLVRFVAAGFRAVLGKVDVRSAKQDGAKPGAVKKAAAGGGAKKKPAGRLAARR